MAQISGESVCRRFIVSCPCPGVVESSFSVFVQRFYPVALPHQSVKTIGYRHSTRHNESFDRLCGQPPFAIVPAAVGTPVPVVAKKPSQPLQLQ